MAVVKYKDTRGKEHIWTGQDAYNFALDEVCRDHLGKPFVSLQNTIACATIEGDGANCFFTLFSKVTTLQQARSAADLTNTTQLLAERTEKYGFKECPSCKAVHTRKVKDCRRCGHEASIPDEADQEVRDFIKRPLPGLDDEPGVENELHEDRLLHCSPDDDPQKIEVNNNKRRRELEDKVSSHTATASEAAELLEILTGAEVIDTDAETQDVETIDTDAPTQETVFYADPSAQPDPMDAMIEE